VAKVPKRRREEIEAQRRRLDEFRALLETRIARDRELAAQREKS
jgi:hypothetical protein